MAPSFYRTADLVEESVIPPETGVIVSSAAKEAAPSATDSNSLFHTATELVGDNQLVDGISVRSPLYLTSFFNSIRNSLSSLVNDTCDSIDNASRKYYKEERRLTTTIASLHSDPREELLPGFTYTAVAAMSGSVLTRNKSIFLRLTTPLLLGAVCFSYVLPSTFSNVAGLAHDMERNAFPRLTETQDKIYSSSKTAVTTTTRSICRLTAAASTVYSKTTNTLKEWTGLNM